MPPEFNPIVARAMAKDPWNRYQRGKDMALALYQLKAHLEEQKALQDLGTMVSAAENLPTLKLSNLQELAAQGAPRATTPIATAAAAAAVHAAAADAPTAGVGARPTMLARGGWKRRSAASSSHEASTTRGRPRRPVSPPRWSARRRGDAARRHGGRSSNERRLRCPLPPPLAPPPVPAPARGARAQDWKKVAKAEVNPKWFWSVIGRGARHPPRWSS